MYLKLSDSTRDYEYTCCASRATLQRKRWVEFGLCMGCSGVGQFQSVKLQSSAPPRILLDGITINITRGRGGPRILLDELSDRASINPERLQVNTFCMVHLVLELICVLHQYFVKPVRGYLTCAPFSFPLLSYSACVGRVGAQM